MIKTFKTKLQAARYLAEGAGDRQVKNDRPEYPTYIANPDGRFVAISWARYAHVMAVAGYIANGPAGWYRTQKGWAYQKKRRAEAKEMAGRPKCVWCRKKTAQRDSFFCSDDCRGGFADTIHNKKIRWCGKCADWITEDPRCPECRGKTIPWPPETRDLPARAERGTK